MQSVVDDGLALPASVPIDVRRAFASLELLYSADEVERAVDQMSVRMTVELQDQNPVLISVLHGGAMLTGMLQRRLSFACQFGYVHVGSYGAGTRPGELKWGAHDVPGLQDRCVVFVDDIIDRGATLAALVEWARKQGAREVKAAVLVKREQSPEHRAVLADFHAFTAGPGFLVGCGMDIAGYGRNFAAIHVVGE